MQQQVAVGVAGETLAVLNLHTANHKRYARLERVRIEPVANPHAHACLLLL